MERKQSIARVPTCTKCGRELVNEIGHHIPNQEGKPGYVYVCHECYDKYMEDERESQERFNEFAKQTMERILSHYRKTGVPAT